MTVEKYQSYCPGDMIKGVALVDQKETNAIMHNWNDVLTISFGSVSKQLYSHQRTFAYDDEDSYAVSGAYYLISLSREYATLEGDGASVYTATISEDFEAIEAVVDYMDLRNDILITRDLRRTVVFSQTSTETIAGSSPLSGSGNAHKFHFDDLPGVRQHSNVVVLPAEGGVVASNSEPIIQGDLFLAMIPPAQWSAISEDDYYDFIAEKTADGGVVLFHPRWIREMPEIIKTVDETDRDRWAEILTTSEVVPTTTEPAMPVLTGEALASCAVDRHQNVLYSVRTVNDTGITRMIGSLTQEKLIELIGTNKISYPVGIT